MDYTVAEVAETLRAAKTGERGCTLLIGAGCSVKAGIPTGAGFVENIRVEWPCAYERATEKNYPKCMGQLTLGERRGLIKRYVDHAKINWAHIAIAQLLKNGFVQRVLTTNFDPLILRACAMVGLFPAVYDFAASQLFQPADVPNPAVFHLHGQYTGFVLMNTKEECEEQARKLEPVFEDAGRGRMWIVVGYSGESDPVFGHLAKVKRFDHGLYWVGYKDAEPLPHVREQLLEQPKDARYVAGYDADSFFVELSRNLDCFPPDFIRAPFTYLSGRLDELTEMDFLAGAERELAARRRGHIRGAIEQYEIKDPLASEAEAMLMAGEYEKVILTLSPLSESAEDAHLAKPLSWAYLLLGNQLSDKALKASGDEADRLFVSAGEKFAEALHIKPDIHEAFYNWGVALSDQAKQKTGEEADRLFATAGEKFAEALRIKPDMHEAHNNWGVALSDQAKLKTSEEADRLFASAGEKYAEALRIKPDKHEALNNWGSTLSIQAKLKTGEEADRLFASAGEKYAAALRMKPDYHEALYNWGTVFSKQAKQKTGEEADRLFASAGEKYAEALRIKPDKHEALNNWGNALMERAKQKDGEEAAHLVSQAREKLLASDKIQPGRAAYNLACIDALQGDPSGCRAWLEKSRGHSKLPLCEDLQSDTDLDSVRGETWFQEFLAEVCPQSAPPEAEPPRSD